MNQISGYCRIRNGQVILNDAIFFQSGNELPELLTALYEKLQPAYPKYFKMDRLSKLAFLGAEVLFSTHKPDPESALVFSNKAASIDTDRNFLKTIADPEQYFPSPSVFVYTLANIFAGELAIRHKIRGENAFFVNEEFNAAELCQYVELLLDSSAGSVVAGWVNVDGDQYEALIYCVEKGNFKTHNFSRPHSVQELEHIYQR